MNESDREPALTVSASRQGHNHWMQRSNDTLSRLIWAGILIYAGLVFLADNAHLLPRVPGTDVWSWIMLGAGGLLLLEGVIRALSPAHARPWIGSVILGLVLLGIGAGAIFNISLSASWWPVILILIGVSMLTRSFGR